MHAPALLFARERNDGVEYEALMRVHSAQRVILFRRDHGGHAKPGQAFDQQMYVFAKRHVVHFGVQAHRGQAIDQQALGADGTERGRESAIGIAKLTQQYRRAGLYDLDLPGIDEPLQVPAEAGSVAQQLGRLELERDDGPGLVVQRRARVNEAQSQRGLARAGRSLDDQIVVARNAAVQDFIESRNSRFDQIVHRVLFRKLSLLLYESLSSALARTIRARC